MSTSFSITRRHAIQGAGLLSAGLYVGASPLSLLAAKSPNEKLNIALVGVGGRGGKNIEGLFSKKNKTHDNVVAICDIDRRTLAKAKTRFTEAKVYEDWRKCLDQKDIDAVVVSTPDHHHTPAALKAMRLDKHVYSEKPLAHTVEEARLMRDTYKARQGKIATQMGTQIHATDHYRKMVQLVQSGALGDIKIAHVWCSRGSRKADVLPAMDIPDYLNWDIWLGPAADRAYNNKYMPGNMTWNKWWDFGNGVLGDMGSHLIDLPYWALDLKHPTRVSTEASGHSEVGAPAWLKATWDHPATDNRPGLQVKWYHGEKRPEAPEGMTFVGRSGIGILFEGTKGWLATNYGSYQWVVDGKVKTDPLPELTIPKSVGHHQEWLLGAKTGSKTLCNFEYSGALIEHNLLGVVAHRAQETLEWDAKQFKATNTNKAEQYITKTYRDGWDPRQG